MLKKGYEFSFAWLFTIIVGATIIFLAVYVATQITGINKVQQQTEAGKQLGIILSPVETNLEQAKFARISLNTETKLLNDCDSEGVFGSQDISAKVSSDIGKQWTELAGFASSFHNKYLFSSKEVYGKKEFYVLSKPLKFPFKIADLIIIWPDTEQYCFKIENNPPAGTLQATLKKEIESLELNKKNVKVTQDCPRGTTKTVCFSSSDRDCDIDVDLNSMKVTHKGKPSVSFAESVDSSDKYALVYAAIFSETEIYECQIKRLAKRASELSFLYINKSEYLTSKGACRSAPAIPNALKNYQTALQNLITASKPSQKLSDVYIIAINEVKRANDLLSCRLF